MKDKGKNCRIGMIVYAMLALVIALQWFLLFDNVILGIIFSILFVLGLIVAFVPKKEKVEDKK